MRLGGVGFVQMVAISIMCNNQGCIAFARDPKHHSRTKHIDVLHHYICERIEIGDISVSYCAIEDMLLDASKEAFG